VIIGKNIRRLREQKGITLSELAEQAGVSKSYLSGMERNLKQNPSIHIIEKLSDVLGVDVETIIETKNTYVNNEQIENEWLQFIEELRALPIDREHLREYKVLMEYIRWKVESSRAKVHS
jgi:XRE family transcriptional regulator of biofilm formation